MPSHLATGPFVVVSSRFDYLGFFWKTTSRFQNTTTTTFLSTIWWFWRWLVINYWLKDELLINSNSTSYNTSQQSRLHSKSVARMSESLAALLLKDPNIYMKENYRDLSVRETLKPTYQDIKPRETWFMDFLDNLRISTSKLFYCCMYSSSCSTFFCSLFARFVMSSDDDQDNSLEDFKSAATIIRFHGSLMKPSGLEPHLNFFWLFCDLFVFLNIVCSSNISKQYRIN